MKWSSGLNVGSVSIKRESSFTIWVVAPQSTKKVLFGVFTFKVSLALKAKLLSLVDDDDLLATSFFLRHLLVGWDLFLQIEHQRPFFFSHSEDLCPEAPQV